MKIQRNREIIKLFNDGKSVKELAQIYGLTVGSIRTIVNNDYKERVSGYQDMFNTLESIYGAAQAAHLTKILNKVGWTTLSDLQKEDIEDFLYKIELFKKDDFEAALLVYDKKLYQFYQVIISHTGKGISKKCFYALTKNQVYSIGDFKDFDLTRLDRLQGFGPKTIMELDNLQKMSRNLKDSESDQMMICGNESQNCVESVG